MKNIEKKNDISYSNIVVINKFNEKVRLLMKFKSDKGITMVNLVIYVICFVVISAIVGNITVFFYNNTDLLDDGISAASEYNKLNLFLVKESEYINNGFEQFYTNDGNSYLLFSNGDSYTFDKINGLMYYNNICLCEFVSDFNVTTDYTSGKEVVNVLVKFDNDNISYKTSYTMK